MEISRDMNLEDLRQLIGPEATKRQAIFLRDTLDGGWSYMRTEDVPAHIWDRLVVGTISWCGTV